MKPFVIASLILWPVAATAASLEDAYLATRDRDIAALTKIEDAKDGATRDAKFDAAVKDLEKRVRAVVGPVAIAGFPKACKLNLDALFPHDEGFGMLDGIACGDGGSEKSIVVTTDGLFDRWLAAHRNWWSSNSLPTSPTEAIKTEAFYTQAVSTDAAVVHYGALPITLPSGSRFAYATLSARTQDQSPTTPDEIFVAFELGGRVYIANAKLDVAMKPVPACDAVRSDYAKRADAAEKAYVNGGLKDAKLTDEADKLRNEGDVAFRACVASKVKETPEFKAADDQAAAIIAAIAGSK